MISPSSDHPLLIGQSSAIHEIRRMAARLATGAAKVLITGESGVGKDVVARYVHVRSVRASQPFIAVNCAGLTETLLEAELFGHVKGSFTGAFRDKPGRIQAAHRGTLFLDEVGEMSLRMQALLLRFLENGEIQPVGSDGAPSRVDVRVIAATNRDLTALAGQGRFREDLIYRLNVVHMAIPPLRERREDIAPLTTHILENCGRTLQLTPAAERALEVYHWPGNVRELQNTIEKLIWTAPADVCDVADLSPAVRKGAGLPPMIAPAAERRRQTANHLYDGLVANQYTFWGHVHPLFLRRDITRHDIRTLVRLGLAATRGNSRALLTLFGIPQAEYKKFLNFLAAHDCTIDGRSFRDRLVADAASATPPAAVESSCA